MPQSQEDQSQQDELQPRIRMAVVRDPRVAEDWCDVLVDAGIEAFVEIDDERSALPGRNPLVGIGWAPTSFVYAVSVPAEERDSAAAVLIDHGWTGGGRGREAAVSNSTRLKGAAVAIGLALVIAVALVWLG